MSVSTRKPDVLTASDCALLVESDDLESSMALQRALDAAAIRGVTELIPASRTILVRFDPLLIPARVLASRIRGMDVESRTLAPTHVVTVPVVYDGEDLEDVARLLKISADEVVSRHTAATWQVAFTGFAPGFGYLVCDDPIFDVPRRASPRTRVPAGAVGLAGLFSGVYPRESPGGWQLIGRTDALLWDLEREPPALFVPGAAVRFKAVRATGGRASRESRAADLPRPIPSPAPVHAGKHATDMRAEPPEQPPSVRPNRLHIIRSPLPILVQDLGRAGHAALGVAPSGAVDRTAALLANRAVGNHDRAAVLELIPGGVVLRFDAPTVAAITGAVAPATLRDANGVLGPPVVHGMPFAIDPGDELTIGAAMAGFRTVVGIRGGVAVPDALGSRATDTLGGVGPAPLTTGDSVPLGDPREAPHAVALCPLLQRALPVVGGTTILEITLGPREAWFTDAAIRILTEQEWVVSSRSNRVGIRLSGETPLERALPGELPSEGAVTGAIQVPPDGQPVLFLADHPLTGGYPIIGAVTDRYLDLAGQLPPGAKVRFLMRSTNVESELELRCKRS